jgi:hypothetical protein
MVVHFCSFFFEINQKREDLIRGNCLRRQVEMANKLPWLVYARYEGALRKAARQLA